MAKKKGKKKARKRNPGQLVVTNKPKNKGKSGGRGKGFFNRALKGLQSDVKDGAQVLGGRYVGEITGEVGARYLGDMVGGFAAPIAQLAAWLAVHRFTKGAFGRLMRIGLLSEVMHGALVDQVGLDIPAQVLEIIPAPAATPTTETAGASGLGALQRQGQFTYSGASPYR